MRRRSRPLSFADLELLLFHLAYLSAGAVLIAWRSEIALGWRLFGAAVAYNLAFPIFAASRVQPRWIRMWSFLLPLSLLQIFPDWYLAEGLGSLVFEDLGFPKIGPVSGFMALLWITPLFLAVYAGDRAAELRDLRAGGKTEPHGVGSWVAALVALVIFGASEATLTLIPVWQAVDVATVGPVALYVLLPEAILGAAAYQAFQRTEDRSLPVQWLAAAAVMLTYLVSLDLSYRVLG